MPFPRLSPVLNCSRNTSNIDATRRNPFSSILYEIYSRAGQFSKFSLRCGSKASFSKLCNTFTVTAHTHTHNSAASQCHTIPLNIYAFSAECFPKGKVNNFL